MGTGAGENGRVRGHIISRRLRGAGYSRSLVSSVSAPKQDFYEYMMTCQLIVALEGDVLEVWEGHSALW